ncbi:MAG TPA: hypothetical protein VMD30_06670 [Tepidisphaeraceae bacterium]|nr:hypothetical protein [Tepidisphaeraceae bacterium]
MTASKIKPALILTATVILAILVLRHTPGLNGPWYWRWPWRASTGIAPYLFLLPAAIPLALAVLFFDRGSAMALPGLLLMMATVFGSEMALRLAESPSDPYVRVISIIEEPGATGYFTHAQALVNSHRNLRHWLGDFPHEMSAFSLHARNKPPGAILFYVPFLYLTRTADAAAFAAGLTIAFLATLSVPATWWFIRALTGDATAAFRGAAFMSLCPGLLVFFPEFDQFYPIYTVVLLLLWVKSLQSPKMIWPILLGLFFSFVCFQTFNLLALGIFVIGYAILLRRPKLALRQASISAATVIAAYAILWLITGYNPIRTLMTGIALHKLDMPATNRYWPQTIPFDLTDFALGTGWISIFLLAFFFLAPRDRRHWPIVLLCLLQIVAVAVAGVLQGETARVWIFLFPLLMLPVGLELARQSRLSVLGVLACLWLIMAVVSQNMIFVSTGVR